MIIFVSTSKYLHDEIYLAETTRNPNLFGDDIQRKSSKNKKIQIISRKLILYLEGQLTFKTQSHGIILRTPVKLGIFPPRGA